VILVTTARCASNNNNIHFKTTQILRFTKLTKRFERTADQTRITTNVYVINIRFLNATLTDQKHIRIADCSCAVCYWL